MLHFVRTVALGAAAVIAAVSAPFGSGHPPVRHQTVISGNPVDISEIETGSLRLTYAEVDASIRDERVAAEQRAAEDKRKADEAAAAQAAADAAAQAAAQAAAARANAAPAPVPTSAPVPAPAAPSGSVQDIIRAAFAPLGQGAVDWALRVARCESGYNPNAYNPSGPYMGLFQFLQSTWNRTPYAGSSPYDASANAHAAAWLYQNSGPGQWGCK